MTPRQIEMLTAAAGNGASHLGRSKYDVSGSAGGVTTLRAIDAPYPYNSRQTIQQTTPGSSTKCAPPFPSLARTHVPRVMVAVPQRM